MDIKSAAIKIQEEIVNWRRDLHRIPELSFELHRTAGYLKEQLDKMKIPWEICAETGIVALIRGERGGSTIALRADMDALEIREETGLPFAAKRPHARLRARCPHGYASGGGEDNIGTSR